MLCDGNVQEFGIYTAVWTVCPWRQFFKFKAGFLGFIFPSCFWKGKCFKLEGNVGEGSEELGRCGRRVGVL